ncbi:hypothetical protein CDD81_6380 [Ophiocordyceps australis]|uniref:Uncharacterized protein n=1 Tax=Ophiocordyceps australis TaxID=1399860 RepID=A0A2C5Y0D7_9HYPO|nr:hypothetical protein CDD81_6380 [Ophiocordyceps australis]
MDQVQENTPTAIFDITHQCLEFFDRIIAEYHESFVTQSFVPGDDAVVSDARKPSSFDFLGLRNSFLFWVDYTGALSLMDSSLDARLRGLKDVSGMVLELLEMILRNLHRINRQPGEPLVLCYNPTTETVKAQQDLHLKWEDTLRAIDSALHRMHFIAVAIRKASAKQLDETVTTLLTDEDAVFRRDIACLIRYRFPAARKALCQQLGDSIAVRRRILLHGKRHANKLAVRRLPQDEPSAKQHQNAYPDAIPVTHPQPQIMDRMAHRPVEIASGITKASRPDPQAPVLRQLRAPKPRAPTTVISTISTTLDDWFEYPPAPIASQGETRVQCPFCFRPLERRELEKQKNDSWKRHIDEHLKPYTCLYHDCAESLVFFARRNEWKAHMESAHSKDWLRKVHTIVWYCDIDHDSPELFETESQWRKHMQDLGSHPKRNLTPPTKAQLAALSPKKQQAALREEYVCPLCERIPDKVLPLVGKHQSMEMYDLVIDHVANHLKSLSLMAVPSLENSTQNPCTSGESVNIRDSLKRLMNENSVAQPPSGIEHLDEATLSLKAWPISEPESHASLAIPDPSSVWDKEYLDYKYPEKPPETRDNEWLERWNLWKREIDPFFGQSLPDSALASFNKAKLRRRAQVSEPHHADIVDRLLESEELWDFLFPQGPNCRFNNIHVAAEGTCRWLFQHDIYNRWASADRALLCIKGKPGAGKSTLLRYVVKNLEARPVTEESPLLLSFFFNGRGLDSEKTLFGFFRSLIYQLRKDLYVSISLANFLKKKSERDKLGKLWHVPVEELPHIFQDSVFWVLRRRPLWLFVDALDECNEDITMNLVNDFKSLLKKHPSTQLKDFRICFTCRHCPTLSLHGLLEIVVERENHADISTFVQRQLSTFVKRELSFRNPSFRIPSPVADMITEKAEGLFLWAQLVVNRVFGLERQGASLEYIKDYIRLTPKGLRDIYLDQTKNMSSDSQKLVQWICFATRPLALDELRWAMLIEVNWRYPSLHECENAGDNSLDEWRMTRRVERLSCELACVSDIQGVQFIHQSVSDFFIHDPSATTKWAEAMNPQMGFGGQAHFQLSRTCIRYLAMEEISQSTMRDYSRLMTTFPLLKYATTCWAVHAKRSQDEGIAQDDILEYFTWPSEDLVLLWVRLYRTIDPRSSVRPAEGTRMLHVLSRYGLIGPLKLMRRLTRLDGTSVDITDGDGRTALSYAVEFGHEAVIELLVGVSQDGTSANVDIADSHGKTPLLYAVYNQSESIVRLLLDKGANIEAQDQYKRTPLLCAVQKVFESIVRLLLDRGADIEARDQFEQTPLLSAIENGSKSLVRLLLTKGANIEAQIEYRRTPLFYAVNSGNDAIVKLLLAQGADIEARDDDNLTSLLLVAARGHDAMVKQLLDCGANAEAKDLLGQTPLLQAVMNRHDTVVKLLLDRGVETDSKDKDDRTPLWWAAMNGNLTSLKHLLDHGANAEAKDRNGRTPLWCATERGNDAMMKLLASRCTQQE